MATYMEAHVAFIRDEHARASVLAEESVALYRDLGDLSGTGLALTVPACVALAEADFARCERLLDESEELLRAAGAWWSLTVNFTLRTNITAMRGDHAQTISLLRESLSLASSRRDTQTIVYGLEGVAGALAMLGRGHRAARADGIYRHGTPLARAAPEGAAHAARCRGAGSGAQHDVRSGGGVRPRDRGSLGYIISKRPVV